jgi:pterin-4a-carbinolamine dehydratase
MNDTKYLIFDFDGVLGDTLHSTITLYCQEFQVDYEETIKTMKYDFDKIKVNITPEYLNKLSEYSLKNSKLFTEFFHQIAKIQNARLAIISLGNEDHVNGLLKHYPDLKFDMILCGWANFSKVDRVNKILSYWGVDVDKAYFFADTLNDIHDLKHIFTNNNLLGCSWGYHGKEILLAELPESQILDQFSDIHKVIDKSETTKKFLKKMYKFSNFQEAFDFVAIITKIAESLGHHPSILLEWGKVEITSTTHDIGNIVIQKDIELMEKIEKEFSNLK